MAIAPEITDHQFHHLATRAEHGCAFSKALSVPITMTAHRQDRAALRDIVTCGTTERRASIPSR
jgi:hypothetical protein